MHKRLGAGPLLILFGFLGLIGLSSVAQACTPVVLVFRHAEDFNPSGASPKPNGGPYGFLTPTGAAHAALYPDMVKTFTETQNYCAVTQVYAANPSKNVGSSVLNLQGAANSFCTARPLARTMLQNAPLPSTIPTNPVCTNPTNRKIEGPITSTSSDAIIFINTDGTVVQDATKTRVGLDEYLNNNGIKTLLLTALKSNANQGKSSAIFWTSQGLHALGNALANLSDSNGASVIPLKLKDPNKDPCKVAAVKDRPTSCGTPPRNAAYVFTASGTGGNVENVVFADTPLFVPNKTNQLTQSKDSAYWLQCFNHVEATYTNKDILPGNSPRFDAIPATPATRTPAGTFYYCGSGESNIGGAPPKTCVLSESGGVFTVIDTCNTSIAFIDNIKIKGKICSVHETATMRNPSSAGISSSRTTIPSSSVGSSYYGACY